MTAGRAGKNGKSVGGRGRLRYHAHARSASAAGGVDEMATWRRKRKKRIRKSVKNGGIKERAANNRHGKTYRMKKKKKKKNIDIRHHRGQQASASKQVATTSASWRQRQNQNKTCKMTRMGMACISSETAYRNIGSAVTSTSA